MENSQNQKPKKTIFKKWWFWVIIVVLVIGVGGAATGGDDSESNTTANQQEQTTGSETDVANEEVAQKEEPAEKPIKMTSVELSEAYDENEVKADKKYKDKTIKLKGEVTEISTVLNDSYVSLQGGGDYGILFVNCYFGQNQTDDLAELSKGDEVTITGTCDGTIVGGYPSLRKCEIK